MEFDVRVKTSLYRAIAERGGVPPAGEMAGLLRVALPELQAAYGRLAARRLLVLEADGLTIRMAPPFPGVPTQHVVRADGIEYFANCAWDALGIPAALGKPAEVRSRCEQSREPLRRSVGREGPEPTTWLFHCAVPAADWWKNIVFT